MSGLEGLLAGRLLGDRYRIEEVIGRGGMGAVYRATDERLGRPVALKVITVAGGTDTESRDRLRARFYREARAAAALPHHPNVVPVYDYGSDPTLHLDYIVMELLRGQDLATRLARSGPPPLASAIRILYEAALGLAVGHRSGLIHRDVKPGNIFLAESGDQQIQVRVVDFGIAKLADDDESLGQLTQDGRVPHSPAFASPEQLRGLSALTPASDVFSLGAVGYMLLTGRRPFSETDRNRMALGMPVSSRGLRETHPAIPAAVEDIVLRALDFEPEDRYADAGAMAREIAGAMRALGEEPHEAYAVGGAAAAAGYPERGTPDEDEVTRLLEESERAGGDADATRAMEADADDHTLLAPPPAARAGAAGAGAAAGAGTEAAGTVPPPVEKVPPPRAFPRREPRRRGVGGKIVWLLLLAVLAAAAYAIWNDQEQTRLARPFPTTEEPESIPEPPDSVPVIAPETPVADTIRSDGQPELQALVLNAEGRRLSNAGEYYAAAENLRRATEIAPGSADYALDYGHTLMRMGRTADAAVQFERAAQLSPERASPHYNLGVARLVLGDTATAWNSLQRAAALSETPAQRAAALREIQAIETARANRPQPRPQEQTPPPATTPVDTPAVDTLELLPLSRADGRTDRARSHG